MQDSEYSADLITVKGCFRFKNVLQNIIIGKTKITGLGNN